MPSWDDLNAIRISPIVAWTDNGADGITLWHWCTTADDWVSTPVPAEDVTSRTPLDLADITTWPCCGLQGHIHHDRWTPA